MNNRLLYYAIRNAQEDVISHVALFAAMILMLDGHPVAGFLALAYSTFEMVYSRHLRKLMHAMMKDTTDDRG